MSKLSLTIDAESANELKKIIEELSLDSLESRVPIIVEKLAPKKLTKKMETSVKKEETVSTESISDTELSETGEVAEPTEAVKEEVSRTANLYPDATKADVQAAMKAAMSADRRSEIQSKMRDIANIPKDEKVYLSNVPEEKYGELLSYLETLVGE